MKKLILLIPVAFAVASAQQTCSFDVLRGTYAVYEHGAMTVQMPAGPFTMSGGVVGVLSIGYDGRVSGFASVSGNGPAKDFEGAGTAQINPDCTGTLTLKWRIKGTSAWILPETDRFVYDVDGKTLYLIVTDMGPGVTSTYQGTLKKISPIPNAASW